MRVTIFRDREIECTSYEDLNIEDRTRSFEELKKDDGNAHIWYDREFEIVRWKADGVHTTLVWFPRRYLHGKSLGLFPHRIVRLNSLI